MEAMKAKEEIRVSALRMLKAAIMKFEVSGDRKEATDADILQLISKEIKQRRDSVEEFTKGNRPDMAEKEQKEIGVLMAYMPPQLSEQELEKLVKEAIAESGATGRKDIGKVMAALMPKVKGMADGAAVNKMVGMFLPQ